MAESREIRKAVVPAAGRGARLLPMTNAVPKEMLPIGRKPVLEIIVDELVDIGITEIIFVISKEKTRIPEYFADASNIAIKAVVQEEQKGLADAILCAEELADDEPFLVALGDSIITSHNLRHPTSRVLDCHAQTDAEAVIMVQKTPRDEAYQFGMVRDKRWDKERFEIDLLVEKPSPNDVHGDYAIAGRYAFQPSVFDYIRRTPLGAGGELQITDSVGVMLADEKPVWGVPLLEDEIRRDIGTFPIYFEAFLLEMLKDAEGAEIARKILSEAGDIR